MKEKTKKVLKTVGVIMTVLLVFGCCYLISNNNINNNSKPKEEEKEKEKKPEEQNKPDEKDPNLLWKLEEFIRIDASTATQPLMDAFVSDFTGVKVKDLDIEYTNTHPSYEGLIDGEKDLIIVTEPSKEELAYAKEKGVELEVIPVVNEAFVFFVNTKNKVNSLTIKNIQDIYSGKITNWKTVGGADEKIIAFQRPVNSGSQTGMLSLVMKGIKMKNPVTEEAIVSMGEIIDKVVDYDNDKAGIGYSYYYYANEMYFKEGIKFIGVNGVKPTFETIKNKTYPLMSAYYIVINKNESKDSKTRQIVNAMLSERGQNVATNTGYVPVK